MTTRTPTLTAALTLALAVTLTGCAGTDADPAPATPTVDTVETEATVDTTETSEATDDATSEQASAADAEDATATQAVAPAEINAAALAAVQVALDHVGGDAIAYGLDDQDDDGAWEVDVADGARSVEVRVAADGREVLGVEEDDDLDEAERTALAGASITLAEAVEAALDEVGGTVEGVELEDENGTWTWDVELEASDRGDVEVRIDLGSGSVLGIDD